MQTIKASKLMEMLQKHTEIHPDDLLAFGPDGIIYGDSVKKMYPQLSCGDLQDILETSQTLQQVDRSAGIVNAIRKEFV